MLCMDVTQNIALYRQSAGSGTGEWRRARPRPATRHPGSGPPLAEVQFRGGVRCAHSAHTAALVL